MKRIFTITIVLAILCAFNAKAQLSGTKTIPGDYATLADAVADLNTQGVGAGGVTLLLGANQNLSAAVQMGSAALSTGAVAATAANPVTIDGAGFTVNGAFAGTRTGGLTASIANDALLVINGTDYVTIRNCIFTQQVTNNTTTLAIENAIALHNRNAASPFDGCQNITIQNCIFNMGEVATGGAAIHAAAHVFGGTTALAWGSAAAAPGDMHRDISITNNTFTGYNFVNYFGATSANGRKLTVNNNNIGDIGGAAVAAYGMYGRYIDSCAFNNNTATMSATQSTTNYIAFLGTNAGGYQEALSNTITIQAAVTTSQTAGIYFTSIGADRKMNGNTINFGPFSALTTGTIFGLYGDYSGGNNNITHEMNGNTCTGQTLGSSTATTATIHILRSISSAGTGRKIIMNNNNITNLTRTGGGTLYPLSPSTAQEVEITGNMVSNITWTNNSTSSSANFGGIYQTSTTPVIQDIFNNTITNIHISGTSSSTAGTFNGIRAVAAATATANNVYGNTINDLGYDAGTNTGVVVGVYVSTASSSVYKNKIYTLYSEQAAGSVNGINIVSGTTNNVYNNIISDLRTPAATGTNAVIGINVSGGTTTNLSYNTIYPSSAGALTSTGASFGGSGIYVSSAVATTIKNNIINITGTAATGYFAAVKRSAGTAGVNPANLTMSNNIYHSSYIYGEGATEASATNLYRYNSSASLGIDDPNFNTACGLFKTFKGDAGSFSEDNVTGAAGIYQPSGSSYAESGATTVTTPAIADDYNSVTRSATTPDMGAIEFSGTLSDASGPAISYTPLLNQNCNNQPTLSAAITDASGVNTSAGTKPRLYYKKHTEANALAGNTSADNGWKYVEASNAASPFTFTVDYSLLTSAPVAGDSIQYFAVSEDLAGTPNVGSNTAVYTAGFCPTTVNLTAPAFPVTGYRNYVINASPTVTVSASPLSVCANNNDTLSVQLNLPGNVTAGNGTVTSSTYTPYYGSTTAARRIQYIVTAAELKALGLRAGNITAISFDIATVPAAFSIADFSLKMGHTSLSTLTTAFSADAATTVLPAGNYTPVVGSNTHTLSTPFAWDGVSNVIIEACHGIAGTASLTTVRYTSGLPSGISCYTTNAAGCAQVTGTTTTIRPNISFTGQKDQSASFTNFAWSDGAGPVGTNNDTIIVQPAFPSGNSMTYSVVVTDASGCSFNGNVTITKNTSTPSGTAAVDKPSICYADSVVLSSTASGGCPPYTYSWSNGASVVGTAASIKAFPTANTTYTLTITDNSGQSFSPAGIAVTVNAPAVTGTTPGSRCGLGTVTLGATTGVGNSLAWYAAATGGGVLGTGSSYTTPPINASTNFYVSAYQPQTGSNVTQGAGATTSATYSNPFYSAWSNNHTQHLITAAELSASGLTAGNINSVALNVTNAGTLPMIDLSVKIGTTTTTSLTAFDNNAGFATVYTNASLLPVTGINVLTFSTPFNWDGTSNIILEFCHGNGASTATMSRTVLADNTSYISSIKAQISAATPAATICADVTSQILTYSLRPQFIFNGTGKCEGPRTAVAATVTAPPVLSTVADATICNNESKMLNVTSTPGDFTGYSWTPLTGLFTDAAGTTAYTGQNLATVYVKSATGGTTNYVVSGTNTGGSECSSTDTVAITVMPATTITASPPSICFSGATTITASPATGYGTGSLQWQQSATGTGGSYTNIPGETNNTYTSPSLTNTAWYGLQIKDGAGNTCVLNPLQQIVVNTPAVTGTTPGTRCGPDSVLLTATASAGATLNWYAAASGGSSLFTGTSYKTPVISTTTNYYVSAVSGFNVGLMGRSETLAGTSATTAATYGLCFNAISNITIDSITVILGSATGGTLVMELRDSLAGSTGPGTFVRATANITIPGGTIGQRIRIPVGFAVPAGNGYRLLAITSPSLIRSSAAGGFPYNSNDGAATITSGFITNSGSTTYYYFYDWRITSGCESSRTMVTATITAPPAIASVADATICNNEILQLNVTSNLSDFDGYSWSPQTGLFTDDGATIPYTGQNLSTVYVKSSTAGTTNYIVRGTNTTGGQCANNDTVAITVMPAPVINPSSGSICLSGTSVLTLLPATGYGTGTLQWQTSATGAPGSYSDISGQTGTSYTTPTITASTYYGVKIKDGAGNVCLTNPSLQVVVNNPSVTGTTPGSRCGSGTVTLGAAGSAGTTINWYTASTGGPSLGSGTSFTTPSIGTTTTYYAEASNNSPNITTGRIAAANPGTATNLTTYGQQFTLTKTIRLNAVDVFSSTGTALTIALYNAGGTTQLQTTGSVSTTAAVKSTIPLGWVIQPGTYRLAIIGMTGNFYRENSGPVYPIALSTSGNIDGFFSSLTGTNTTTASYYFMYNWNIDEICAAPRTAVTATVNSANVSYVSNLTGATYQWQVNTGSGFGDITNGAVYGGTTTATLTLSDPPTSYNGYIYRCVVDGTNFSNEVTYRVIGNWTGAVSTDWMVAGNWSCNVVPDANTDVHINYGVVNYPVVGQNITIRSLKINPGATVTVGTGFNITLTGF